MTASVLHGNFSTRTIEVVSPELVSKAAAILARHTDTMVVVQGNKVFVANTEYNLSITVGWYSSLRVRPFTEDIREWRARQERAPRVLGVDIHADVEWLVNHALALDGIFGGEYASVDVLDVDAAETWLRENCHRAPVPRITAVDREMWKARRIVHWDGERFRTISLDDAVGLYGPLYKYEISATVLVNNHKMSMVDAQAVVDAVMKNLPRRSGK